MTEVIYNGSLDPYFNLAAEQYLLEREDSTPVFMLWRNSPAVIIGKNQNAYAELNEAFIRKNKIKTVRRLTGGGAVFHDEGNVNYTFISPKEGAKALDFARFCAPIIDALCDLGAKAELSGRNDIEIGGRKVSGNAQTVYGNKILHHGTLLWSADLSRLAGALKVDPEKIASKGIKSVRSRVANIRDIIGSDMDTSEFINYLFSRAEAPFREFTDAEISAINRLRDSRYSTWEWNWGTSKDFSAHRKARFGYGKVEISFDSYGGVITGISFGGDFFGREDILRLEEKLVGTKLEFNALKSVLCDVNAYIAGADAADIASLILSF
ncbi:MAG: lipoate--protein ligase [Clostridia bacterium]|nr:lipoate--protein ligase [Clostridia bacterium]